MKIESVIIKRFRCFDDSSQEIKLDDLTCFVGPNASGKTAAMMALARLFSESPNQRQVQPSDFHLAPGEELNAKSPRVLSIECRLTFPELEEGEVATTGAIPEAFNQMIVDEPGGTPFCRIRLEATWMNDGTPTGDIDQSLSWILTSSDDLKVIEDGNRRKVQSGDRAKIRVVYVPAARDPGQQIRTTTATSFGRLLGALAWGGADETLKGLLEGLQSQIAKLPGVQTMNTQVQKAWQGFYDGLVAREVVFRTLEEDPAALVKVLVPIFRPGEDGRTLMASDLSDGLRALFSLSLSLGLFRVEELLRTEAVKSGFKAEVAEGLPILTVFAVEEPENHLSPHNLGRVTAEIYTVSSDEHAQVLLSSHSPSMLRRVQPVHVRYFLGNEKTHSSRVKPIPLPEEATDAFKYVRDAVRGFPELYFAHLVILGEGPSEEIVLRRLFEASGTPLDRYFIRGLEIQYLTLLDLDREKEGAGWGRLQYVRDQIVKLYGAGHEDLRFQTDKGNESSLDNSGFEKLAQNPDTKNMDAWHSYFRENFGVFFSSPLDLDFSMLGAFPAAYKGLAPPPKGPRLPAQGTPDYREAVINRMKQVLAADASDAPAELGSTYTKPQQELFPWYKYLFVDRSKPVAHLSALVSIDEKSLVAQAPEELKALLERARWLVTPAESGD
jgi:putative ATP-dependent endonuclease of OLD family